MPNTNLILKKYSVTLIRNEEPVTILRIEGDSLVEVLAKFPLTVQEMQLKISENDFKERIEKMKDDEIPF